MKIFSVVMLLALLLAGKHILAGERGHEHKPPHNGTLVLFGDEFAHLELVLDKATGVLKGYALDGEAEKAVRVKQQEIEIKVKMSNGQEILVKLAAVANVLTGETLGDTSEFAGRSEHLKGLSAFDAEVVSITIRGKQFKNVTFNFPKGNEEK